MHEIKINQTSYDVKTSWGELDYQTGVNIIKDYQDKTKVLSHVSGIPIDVINKISDIDVSKLFGLISFTEDLSVFENITPKEEYKDFKFKAIEYGEAEYCRKIMNSGVSGYEAVVKIIERLKKVDISKQPLTEVIGTANFFLTNSIISMVVMPSLVGGRLPRNKQEQVLEDSIILGALELMLSSLEVERSETPST